MAQINLTGPSAGTQKYDLLTALSVAGLHGKPVFQMSMMRLIALVTARYNWRSNEVSIGQRDLARMWNVNERTVKREMKRLIDTEILVCSRAGVRGRVGAYRLNFETVKRLSDPLWESVGPDFQKRMETQPIGLRSKVVKVDFGGAKSQAPPEALPQKDEGEKGTWLAVQHRLNGEDHTIYSSWYKHLSFSGYQEGEV
ncbi:hypothetical protein AB9F26_22205, partial [Falsihalocynthiibacter sp. BN13B15]